MQDTLGYWDGQGWTGQVQPAKNAGVKKSQQPAVIIGSLIAVAFLIFVIVGLSGAFSRSDCTIDRWEQGRSAVDC